MNLVLYPCNAVLFDLNLQGLLHKFLVVLCILGHTTLLRTIRVVLDLRCCLSLFCYLFMIDSLSNWMTSWAPFIDGFRLL